jgi:RecA-family ATPase
MEDAGLGSRRFLDLVDWYNNRFPDNHITIPSEADTVASWLRRPEPQIQWDIEQLMAKGTTLIIAGNVGIGKSWETKHLAFKFRLGESWHGLQCRQLMPIYISLEFTENQMRRRIGKLANIYPNVRDINFLAHKGANYKLNTDVGRENLLNLLRGYGQNFDVLIFDPLALFIDDKLDKVDWNGKVEPILTQIKHDFGCSIIFNHNFRKKVQIYGHSEDMFAPDRLKGVSDIIDRADNIVIFVSESQPRRNEQGESQRVEIAKWMHAAKTRDAEVELRPHRVRWDYGQAMLVPEEEQSWIA